MLEKEQRTYPAYAWIGITDNRGIVQFARMTAEDLVNRSFIVLSTPHVVHRDPDILGGTPVFTGTRVPVNTLLDYLEAGDSLDVFLDHFPSVSHEQAIAALELAKQMLTTYANPG
jgi:uncharacterized protein (DUF433 family)